MNVEREAKLVAWLTEKIEVAKLNGEPMFMGIPDLWFGTGLHCCNSGHIFMMYLKSETLGNVCLRCLEPSHLLPNDVTQDDLTNALK